MKQYFEAPQEVLQSVGSSAKGLTQEEAAERLTRDGRNKLAAAKKVSLVKRFLSQLADPMILILIAAAVISAITSLYSGESFADVIIILLVVIINAVLGVYQESKAEKAIEALQSMSAATSRVLRNGQLTLLPSEELVVGDIVFLEAGDAVPADGRIIECASLKVEESALTGESVPVEKMLAAIELREQKDIPLGDRRNMVYMGSSVSYGRGVFVVTAIGMQTEMGKIADALAKTKEGKTPLQIKLAQLSRILTWLVLGICVVIFAVNFLRAGSFSAQVLLDSFLIAISLAVAAIPEGLAAVVTIVLSIGVTNMSRRNAIICKLTAVETLGCAQIICSDKTGTLTQNKMTVVDFWGTDEALLAKAMALCSDAEYDEAAGDAVGEPTECALVNWAQKTGNPKQALKESEPRIGEAPFDSMRKIMSTVHRCKNGYYQYTKGAPDAVLNCCTHYLKDGAAVPMDEEMRQQILQANRLMAQKALRVLMGACRIYDNVPASFMPQELETDLCFVGLVGMIDPIRPEVKAAIVQCRTAGIRPIMITGDHLDTAKAIARDLDILQDGMEAINGQELDQMDDAAFAARFEHISVYARVQPEHKTRIVNAWQNAGYITAMTGDGVNDAPSIKKADIGVGMGITGTDVTKNVADMVLADDNFATIVGAVEEGRRIYDNIRKAIQFLLGSNLSEVLSIFIATLLGFTILKPVHLLWINLITDCFPALALGTEQAEAGIMERKPRPSTEGIFAGGMGVDVAYQGLLIALLTLAAYFVGMSLETNSGTIISSGIGTTMAFLTMSFAETFHCFNMRSQRKSLLQIKTGNRLLLLAGAVSLICSVAVVFIPFLRNAFSFTGISFGQFLISLALGVCVVPIVELVKLFQRSASRKKQ